MQWPLEVQKVPTLSVSINLEKKWRRRTEYQRQEKERGAWRRIDLGMKHTGGGEYADGICICIASPMITSTQMMNDGTYRIFPSCRGYIGVRHSLRMRIAPLQTCYTETGQDERLPSLRR